VPGFLLADDAIGARKQVFDDWIGEQKRNAEQAAQQAAQAAQAAAQQHASDVAARAQQFQDWVGQQAVSPTAPAAPQQPTAPAVEPQVVSAPPPAVGPLTQPSTPEAQDRASKFQDWVAQQNQAPAPFAAPAPSELAQSPATPAPNATDATPVDRSAGRVFPVQGYQGQVDLHWGDVHGGSDLFAPRGTPVVAMQGGQVLESGENSVGGNAVLIRGNDGLQYYYAHLDSAPSVKVGEQVGAGTYLGPVGDTGDAKGRGTHLHIGIGPDIRLGADKYGGTGGDFDATSLLRSTLDPNGGGQTAAGLPPSRFNPMGQSTAGMSGGGARAGQLGDQGQQILSGAADAASWLGNDGQKALQSILVTEGGLAGARGDSGRSAGPLQFFEGGQLGNFARAFQMSLEQAKTYVEQHPLEAIRWAIGVPSNPGYLGAAIVSGLQRNLSGPDLATYAQRTGQVSESPERAGDNYRNLFGQGQDVVRAAGTAVEGALEAGRQVSTRAADLIGQGQQLVQQGAQGARDAWSQFDNAQSQRQADNQRWFDEQRSRVQGDVQDRLQQGQEFTQSLQDRMRQFQANAEPLNRPPLEGFTAPGGPAERIGQGLSDFGSLMTQTPPDYRSQFEAQRSPEERQQQLEQTTDIGTGGLAPDVRAALLMGRADEKVGADSATLIVQKAKDMGWEPDERQERLATGVLSALTPLNVMSLLVTGPEQLTMKALAEGAMFLGLSGVGGVAGSELFPDSPIAPLVGALALPIAGPAALRGVRAGLGTPTAQAALRARQPAQAEAGFAAGMPRRPSVEPEVPTTRVYHGTTSDFDRVRTDLPAVEGENTLGPGYYVTPNPDYASMYARDQRGHYDEPSYVGANVRAIDMPSNAKLFDLQTADDVTPGEIERLSQVLRTRDPERAATLQYVKQTVADAGGEATDLASPDALWRFLTTGRDALSVTEANRLIERAGYDGIRGGDEGTVIFGSKLNTLRNAISGRQGGQIDPEHAIRLGSAAIGGYAGYQSTPEDAGPLERAGRTLGGVGLGLAAPGLAKAAITRPQIDQTILESLRRGGVTAGPPAPSGRVVGRNVGTVMDMTKQGILLDPVGRIMDMVSNTIELVRQPAALAMAGRGPEAAAGLAALGRAIPEALQNSKLALQGLQVPTLGQGAGWTGRSGAVFRVMGAADMFTRTLGEYQGMAAKAFQMLDEANIKPGTPQADQYLAQHADELYREGARSGSTSVFGQSKQAGQQSSQLDKLMAGFSNTKEHLLNSSSLRDKALGTLLDFEIPFSGTPSRVWQTALQRVPGITQVSGVARIAKALEKGDAFAAQKAFGEMALESMIQAQVAQGIREGNITGPDDPEHPSSVQVAGQWIPIKTFGVYGVPMGVMAAFAESWEKTGRQPDPEVTDRVGAALNASMKPIVEGVPGFQLVKTLASLGQGGLTRGVTDTASDIVGRFSPSILARAENMVDPFVRDIATRGPQQIWEPTFARNVALAHFLPPKLDPTTGEPRGRGVSILGGATKPSSELTAELARLERKGYQVSPPDDKPSSVTINGVPVPVKDGSPEQRAMVKARGELLAQISQQMKQPSYARMTDDQKAQMWSSMIDRTAKYQAGAWLQSVDPLTAGRILGRGRPIAGRLQDMDETEQINQQVAQTNLIRRQQREMARA
jgi:murein DD-endopeptidase MepM/ murein hydrolase activator NlpD